MDANSIGAILLAITILVGVYLAIKWLAFPVAVSNAMAKLLKQLEEINAKLGPAPEPPKPPPPPKRQVDGPLSPAEYFGYQEDLQRGPAKPQPASAVTASCAHCGGEFTCAPDTQLVTCPHCQQETPPESPLRRHPL